VNVSYNVNTPLPTMNQNRLKTIITWNWRKTAYDTNTLVFFHVSNRSKLRKTFITSNSSVITTE
jgi:hypothetical protein